MSTETAWGKWIVLGSAAVAVLVVAFLVGRTMGPAEKPVQPATAPVPADRPAAEAAPAPREPEAEPLAPAAKPRPRRKPEPAPRPAPAPAAPTAGELRIESDVPGAMIFLDRKYLGNAPVTARDVAPGSHVINGSAEGYDGVSETVDVAPGPAEVTLKFKEIRLNEAVDVVHKHGIGSCEGRLLATPRGIRYETTNKDDAFSLPFAEIETFEVDYLKKNLKIKKRGGKTWNFTTKADTADPLFVFHRNVDKVRQRIAQ